MNINSINGSQTPYYEFSSNQSLDMNESSLKLQQLFKKIGSQDLTLEQLNTVIPLEAINEDDVARSLEEAKNMFEEAKLYLQMAEGGRSKSLQAQISSILDGIIAAIESIINAFGIGDFFKPAESALDAEFKSSKIMLLLSLFGTLTGMFVATLGTDTGSAIVGGVLVAISALSIVWPFIKPMPIHLPSNAENWTKQVQDETLVAQGRKESLDDIARILTMNRHAILVGPSRVGKSLTAKAFAQAVERGDYPELKGKVVFHINTTDLVGQNASFLGGGNRSLKELSEVMGRHRDNIILVLDEIHMACKDGEKLADQLKTFLDEGGEFPHVIGITTDKEYKHVRDNNAFSLRFDKVDIQNTSEDETLKILADTALKSRSKPLVTDEVLAHIYKKSCSVQNAPQPATAIKLLKQCINLTGKIQKSPIDQKITKISNQILSLRSQAAIRRGRKSSVNAQIKNLKTQMRDLQEEASLNRQEVDKLFASKAVLDRVTKEMYRSVIKLSDAGHLEEAKLTRLFMLLHNFLVPALESHIEKKSKELQVPIVIDRALVDKAISKLGLKKTTFKSNSIFKKRMIFQSQLPRKKIHEKKNHMSFA
jgi:ATP-dependent Clp protease ATP-binding subunit ClpA